MVAQDLFKDRARLEAHRFADAVLEAEGMTPEYEVKWHREIKRRFTDRYGESITADEYED